MRDYVEVRGEDYMLLGSRVSLASIVAAWKEGLSPETIHEDFPTLRLEQIYGAITYYLANQSDVDHNLAVLNADFEHRRAEQQMQNPELVKMLRSALNVTKR